VDNYARIVAENIEKLYTGLSPDLAAALPAVKDGDRFRIKAFGAAGHIGPEGIFLGGKPQWGVPGILISLYALHASRQPLILEPPKAFKELPHSAPYAAAFATHSERILVPRVARIAAVADDITARFDGRTDAIRHAGDFAFVLYPLPKIALFYIFYHQDEDFPASATCLFSSNADAFLPTDALADVAETTSKQILRLVEDRG
jgi:hypothetical protein